MINPIVSIKTFSILGSWFRHFFHLGVDTFFTVSCSRWCWDFGCFESFNGELFSRENLRSIKHLNFLGLGGRCRLPLHASNLVEMGATNGTIANGEHSVCGNVRWNCDFNVNVRNSCTKLRLGERCNILIDNIFFIC